MGNLGDQGKKITISITEENIFSSFFLEYWFTKHVPHCSRNYLHGKLFSFFLNSPFSLLRDQKSCTRLLADFWLAYLSPLQLKIALFLTECLSKYKLNSNFGKCKLQGTTFKDCHKKF